MPFVSIDLWTIIMQWGNLLILMLLMKKFLFKPVMSVLEAREAEIKKQYDEAESTRKTADKLKQEYTQMIDNARSEADEIVKDAVKTAKISSEDIIADAQAKSNSMIERAMQRTEIERKATLNEVKNNLSDMAISIAGKVIEKDINADDHSAMIDKFIEELGDAS